MNQKILKTEKESFQENFLDKLVLDQKMEEIKILCINKIAKFRDFLHLKHKQKPLNESWSEDQLPPDIFDDYKQQQLNISQKKKKKQEEKEFSPSVSPGKKGARRYSNPTSIFDKLRAKKTSRTRPKSFTQKISEKYDNDNINPNVLTMEMKSEKVAKLSVNFYVKQIEKNAEWILGNDNMEKIVRALYDDAARFHWCLRSFKLMYYFVSFSIFIISASGTNTPSERGIKAVKYYGTPERNRMKSKALNALNHIHEKILEDDFNTKQSKNSIATTQACKTIMRAFGFHNATPTKPIYEKLITEIKNQTRFVSNGITKIYIL